MRGVLPSVSHCVRCNASYILLRDTLGRRYLDCVRVANVHHSAIDVDLDGDGVAERVAWTAAGSDDAFLAIDENHNGRIDGGHELLGAWRSGPPNGFAALAATAAYPRGATVEPGFVTPRDAIFKRLILWADADHDGVSDEDEMMSLTYAGFTKLFLGYQAVGAPDRVGNLFLWNAQALMVSEHGVEVARTVTAIALGRSR